MEEAVAFGDDDPEVLASLKPQSVTIDNIVDNYAGGGSFWQWRTFFLLMPLEVVSILPVFLDLFTAFTPVHRCLVPQCEDLDAPLWMHFAIPEHYRAKEFLSDGQAFDPCHAYPFTNGTTEGCQADHFNRTAQAEPCHSYHFDRATFTETIATKFELVCDREDKARFLGTVMMLGLLFGSAIGGFLGDYLGRKRSIFLAVAVLAPATASGALSNSYEMYSALRLVSCTCLPGMSTFWSHAILLMVWVNHNAYLMETFSAKQRATIASFKWGSWPVAMGILALVVYLARHWILVHCTLGGMSFLVLITWPWINESLRWLVEKGKIDEATSLLQKMASVNGKPVPASDMLKIKEGLTLIAATSPPAKKAMPLSHSVISIFGKNYLATTLLLICLWVCSIVGAFTLALNATKLSGDIFWNFFLTGASNIPSYFVMNIAVRKLGRVRTVSFFFIGLGLTCLVLAFVPKHYQAIIVVIYFIGKGFASGTVAMTMMVSSELYPTNLRSQASGICSMIARAFGLVCPFVANLAVFWKPLPMVVLGLPCILSGALAACFLPDSSGDLPQSINQAMQIKRREPSQSELL